MTLVEQGQTKNLIAKYEENFLDFIVTVLSAERRLARRNADSCSFTWSV